ncbi:MAG: hypothetical protein MPJ50_01315 [Pirellulales bacterium]|nr:hypothetical protein [Pirellulales bacterium]
MRLFLSVNVVRLVLRPLVGDFSCGVKRCEMAPYATETYVRFQSRRRYSSTGRPGGVFVAAAQVEDSHQVSDATRQRLRETLDWFNQNLKAPSLEDRDWRTIFWFREDAQPLISQMWQLVSLLEEEGVPVRKLWTRQPGQIVYRDQLQIAAIPQRQSPALRL